MRAIFGALGYFLGVVMALVSTVVGLLLIVLVAHWIGFGLPQSSPTTRMTITQRPTSVADETAISTRLSQISAAKCKKPDGFWHWIVNEHSPKTVTVLVTHPSATDGFTVDCSSGKISGSFSAW